LNATFESAAAAVEKIAKKRFQTSLSLHIFKDQLNLPMREFLSAWSDWGIIRETVQENLSLAQCESHFTCSANEKNPVERVAWVTPLPADTMRCGKQAHLFVIAHRGSVEPGSACEFADLHFHCPCHAL
jgi:hypothetical protein